MEIPDVPDAWKDNAAPTKPEVGEYYLPGVGRSYLNPEFADKVADLVQRSLDQGISLKFRYGYRTQAEQDGLRSDPTAITPARYSLHSGIRNIEISGTIITAQSAQPRD